MFGINNNNNYPNQFQSNYNYQNPPNQIPRDTGYSSMDFINNNQQPQNTSMNKQINYSNQVDSNMPINIRYTEVPRPYQAPQIQQNINPKDISRMTEFNRGQDRPLWSYREIQYDEFRIPRDTENIATTSITRKGGKENEKEIMQPKNAFDDCQKKDEIYFNNNNYQKSKVTKKLKNNEISGQKRGHKMVMSLTIIIKIIIIITIINIIIITIIIIKKILIIMIFLTMITTN